jgi:hypothetical protein
MMPELIKIPTASAEYQARFDRPYIGLVASDMQRVYESVLVALLPFKLRLADTEVDTSGRLADHKVVFRIPDRGISFQFGAEGYRFGKVEPSWAKVDEDTAVLAAAEGALLAASGAKIKECVLTIAMHMQPLSKTREEVLAPFVPEPFKTFLAVRNAQTFGNHLKWANGNVLLDFSVAVANGIFLRLTSEFEGHPPLPEILAKIREDQSSVLEILGVAEADND